jgi:hypothetical protein
MSDLRIRIKKKSDGAAALSCIRSDGSVSWQRQDGQLGRIFPLHDLTHLAVESVLELDRAFYGLIAGGWDVSYFGDPRGRAELPEQALLAELIVGYFDLERATGHLETADDYNEKIRTWFADRKLPPPALVVTEPQVHRIREVRAALFAQWKQLPAGETLELAFERHVQTPVRLAESETHRRQRNVG